MWRIDYFVLASDNYNQIQINHITKFNDMVTCICKYDNFFVPNDFYTQKDKFGITASDFMFSAEQTDESMLLYEIITKQKTSSYTYSQLFYLSEPLKEIGFVPINNYNIDSKLNNIIAYNIIDITKIKRYYFKKILSYEDFKHKASLAYLNLIFHHDAFNDIKKFGDIKNIIDEIDRHLSVLNDFARDIYDQQKDENITLSILQSKHNIICSGKGSNEGSFKKVYTYNNTSYTLTCNPHTKLFNSYSPYRIYFCWGRNEIHNNNIIIVHMGDHWD